MQPACLVPKSEGHMTFFGGKCAWLTSRPGVCMISSQNALSQQRPLAEPVVTTLTPEGLVGTFILAMILEYTWPGGWNSHSTWPWTEYWKL